MSEELGSPEERDTMQAIEAELDREAGRVGVRWPDAQAAMREIAAPAMRTMPDGSVTLTFSLDLDAMVAVLRALPDGAGTDAFVTAFRRLGRADAGDV